MSFLLKIISRKMGPSTMFFFSPLIITIFFLNIQFKEKREERSYKKKKSGVRVVTFDIFSLLILMSFFFPFNSGGSNEKKKQPLLFFSFQPIYTKSYSSSYQDPQSFLTILPPGSSFIFFLPFPFLLLLWEGVSNIRYTYYCLDHLYHTTGTRRNIFV